MYFRILESYLFQLHFSTWNRDKYLINCTYIVNTFDENITYSMHCYDGVSKFPNANCWFRVSLINLNYLIFISYVHSRFCIHMNIRIRVDLIRLEKYLIQRNIRQSHSQPYRQHHIYIYIYIIYIKYIIYIGEWKPWKDKIKTLIFKKLF